MSYKVDKIVNDPQHKHFLTLPYTDIVPFIFKYLKKHSVITISTWTIILLSIVYIVFLRIGLSGYTVFQILPYTLTGLLAIPILLIVPHEILHILPLLFAGARDIRSGFDRKQMLIYVTAHNYPVMPVTFIVVAILPLVVVTLTQIFVSILLPPLWQWSIALSIPVHLSASLGDISLINFYFTNRDKRIVTWDDAVRREAYFYEI